MISSKSAAVFQLCASLLIVIISTVKVFPQPVERAAAKIICNSFSISSDSIIQLGLLVQLGKDWHIYWKNYGDIGIPTSIEWKIPSEYKFFEKQWPIPKAFDFEELVSYGYDKQVLFIIDLLPPKNNSADTIVISAKLESLICRDICIPFDTVVEYKIDLRKDYSADVEIEKIFMETKNNLPVIGDNNAGLSAAINLDKVLLRLDKSSAYYDWGNRVNFIPYENGLFKNSVTQVLMQKENFIELVLETDPFRTKEPNKLQGLMIFSSSGYEAVTFRALEIDIPISK